MGTAFMLTVSAVGGFLFSFCKAQGQIWMHILYVLTRIYVGIWLFSVYCLCVYCQNSLYFHAFKKKIKSNI